jgi:hypothetical protein
LGVIFTISGLAGGVFSLTAPLFVRHWSKLRLITSVQYLTAPIMLLIGFSPLLPVAIGGEYTRSFMRTLIESMPPLRWSRFQISSEPRCRASTL